MRLGDRCSTSRTGSGRGSQCHNLRRREANTHLPRVRTNPERRGFYLGVCSGRTTPAELPAGPGSFEPRSGGGNRSRVPPLARSRLAGTDLEAGHFVRTRETTADRRADECSARRRMDSCDRMTARTATNYHETDIRTSPLEPEQVSFSTGVPRPELRVFSINISLGSTRNRIIRSQSVVPLLPLANPIVLNLAHILGRQVR